MWHGAATGAGARGMHTTEAQARNRRQLEGDARCHLLYSRNTGGYLPKCGAVCVGPNLTTQARGLFECPLLAQLLSSTQASTQACNAVGADDSTLLFNL